MSAVDERFCSPPSPPEALASPQTVRRRVDRLLDRREERVRRSSQLNRQFQELRAYLDVADEVTAALEALSEELLNQLLGGVQEKLTVALQEILEQPICFRARPDFKRGATTVEFYIERNGQEEDILRGQGGSVANVLSVGLRMFALMTLDEAHHRRFLVLDEQDCWLRPDLVPRLVKIVHDAGRALGFQVLMISHHDPALFERYADKIYRFRQQTDGSVTVEAVTTEPGERDYSERQDAAE